MLPNQKSVVHHLIGKYHAFFHLLGLAQAFYVTVTSVRFTIMYGGDGGNRTHVQEYRHLSFYERSHYIMVRRCIGLVTGRCKASLINLFCRPQTAAGQRSPLHSETPVTPHGRWRAGSAVNCYAATARFSLDLPVIIGVGLYRDCPARLAT